MESQAFAPEGTTPSSSPDAMKPLHSYQKLQAIALSNPQYSTTITRLLYQIGLKILKDNQAKLSNNSVNKNINNNTHGGINHSAPNATTQNNNISHNINSSPIESPPNRIDNESTVIRLVRPKSLIPSNRSIDKNFSEIGSEKGEYHPAFSSSEFPTNFSSKSSSKQNKKSLKKKSNKTNSNLIKPSKNYEKVKSNTNSSSYKIKRSFSTFLIPPRNIYTPDWVEGPLSANPSQPSDSHKFSEIANKFHDFDIVAAHSKIEVFEARIQMGEDEAHPHPALARVAADECEDVTFSDVEIEKSQRYVTQKVIQPVPLFWPPRVYDTEENMMSVEQTKKFAQAIKKEIDSVGEARPHIVKKKTPSKSSQPRHSKNKPNKRSSMYHDGRPRKVGRPPKVSSLVTLDFNRYDTDNEDECLTDFEDF
ncbi:hypothetical protein TRFO_22991 [Tritrichomonas foetus]|uniref:Uncharacterized protein n=1 Tax=Tritrichomonas foetus TaxID=1144522 RepID=A0A1J4KAL6_9EUKA|nr:hypothetical protein TRFO_22991 [Tritrichomonas foetus]|eukprot:OHT08479.1 hypothetical protein TRFO_22991 [Tritrichomonas foetus]